MVPKEVFTLQGLTPPQRGVAHREVRLKGGAPAYHALIEVSPAGVANRDSVIRARAAIAELTQNHPDVLKKCIGKTADQARAIIEAARA